MLDAHIQLPNAHTLDQLTDTLDLSGIRQVLAIQPTPDPAANQTTLNLAQQSNGLIAGVILSAPIDDSRALHIQLDTDSHHPLASGYVADIHQTDVLTWINDEDTQYGINLIARQHQPLDLVLTPTQLPHILPFLDAHPQLPIILDHCLGDAADITPAWQRLLREIGRRPHVHYRLSSLAPASEGETAWQTTESVKTTFDAALAAFTPARLLYASGWPVTPARYPVWLNTIDNLIHTLSQDEKNAISTTNTQTLYQLT